MEVATRTGILDAYLSKALITGPGYNWYRERM
jgi:hypothetical protein